MKAWFHVLTNLATTQQKRNVGLIRRILPMVGMHFTTKILYGTIGMWKNSTVILLKNV